MLPSFYLVRAFNQTYKYYTMIKKKTVTKEYRRFSVLMTKNI